MKNLSRHHTFFPVSINWIWLFISFFMLCLSNVGKTEEIIEVTLPNKTYVTAYYSKGTKNHPAILVVHGFLQTRNYLTVSSLTNSLKDSEYTVLAPTLSLGINRRQRSLACDAIHTHTMQDDINEISFWVNWLIKKGHNKIILVGHSYGSLQILVYASENPNPAVKNIIATSLLDGEQSLGKDKVYSQIETAHKQFKKNKTSLNEYQISYCKKFVAPAGVFLSYAKWTKQRILSALSDIKIPIRVILGSNDKRIDHNWPRLIKAKGASINIIHGANHFFDAEHEFDLFEEVQEYIDSNETTM